jgi:hypothetical protein
MAPQPLDDPPGASTSRTFTPYDAQSFDPFETTIAIEIGGATSVVPCSSCVDRAGPPLKHQERDLAPIKGSNPKGG